MHKLKITDAHGNVCLLGAEKKNVFNLIVLLYNYRPFN